MFSATATTRQPAFGLEDPGEIYGRLGNPTQGVFEQRIAALEGGTAALAVASGAAAICYTIQNLAKQGDHIVSANNIYGGTYNLLAHTLVDYGVTTTFVAPSDYDRIEASFRENTKALYIETLGNPNSDVVDIERLAQIAHAHKVPLVVDNTFATPYLVRPFEYGADIVVHSATKFIGGHGTSLGGVIVENGKFDWEGSGKFPHLCTPNPSYHGVTFTKAAPGAAFVTAIRAMLLRDMGGCISPVPCFYFLTGTGDAVSARGASCGECTEGGTVSEQPSAGRARASSFRIHRSGAAGSCIRNIFPNGGGSIFTFEIKGGKETAKKFCDNLELFSLLANVADVKSLVIHPASTTHAQLSEEELNEQGIYSNTIRLSIGTENIDDIIEDLEGGFQSV